MLAIALALVLAGCDDRDDWQGEREVVRRFADPAAIDRVDTPHVVVLQNERGFLEGRKPEVRLDGHSEWRYFALGNELGPSPSNGLEQPAVSFDYARRQLALDALFMPPGTGCAYASPLPAGGESLWVEALGTFETPSDGDSAVPTAAPGPSLTLTVMTFDDPSPAIEPRLAPGSLRSRLLAHGLTTTLIRPTEDGAAARGLVRIPRDARSIVVVAAANGERIERLDGVAVFRLPALAELAVDRRLDESFTAWIETGRVARPSLVVPSCGSITTRPFLVPPRAELRFQLAALSIKNRPLAAVVELLDGDDVTAIHRGKPAGPEREAAAVIVDLSAKAGRTVRLRFNCVAAGDSHDPPLAIFGSPLLLGESGPERASRGHDVVIVSIDTLRADRLGCAGNSRGLTPNLDWLAARGTRFTRAYSHAPWTLPSHATLFTGLLPPSHGVETNRDGIGDALPRLTTSLADAGWRTAAFTAGGYVSRAFGFGNGFDRFCEIDPIGDRWRTGEASPGARFPDGEAGSLKRAIGFLIEARDTRSFLFLHTFIVHGYQPPVRIAERFGLGSDLVPPLDAEYARRFEPERVAKDGLSADDARRMIDAYDATVAAADEMVGDVIRLLIDRDRFDDTILIVTSDHGQELLDHGGAGHGVTLYDEALRVPLIVRVPGRAEGEVVDATVGLADLAPTVLALLELPPLPDADGESLASVFSPASDGDRIPARAVIATVRDPFRSIREAIVADGFKLIRSEAREGLALPVKAERELFALDADPWEWEDRATREPDVRARLEEALASRLARCEEVRKRLPSAAVAAQLPPDVEAQLRELGYLGAR